MRTEKAFTLVEALFVVLLIAIVASIAVRNFREARLNNEIRSFVFTLGTALSLAKDEAVMRRSSVTLCPSPDVNAENPVCDPDGDWLNGYIAFLDLNPLGERDPDNAEAERLLRVYPPSSRRNQIAVGDMPGNILFGATGFRRADGLGIIQARIGQLAAGDDIQVDTSKLYFELNIAENGTFKIYGK